MKASSRERQFAAAESKRLEVERAAAAELERIVDEAADDRARKCAIKRAAASKAKKIEVERASAAESSFQIRTETGEKKNMSEEEVGLMVRNAMHAARAQAMQPSNTGNRGNAKGKIDAKQGTPPTRSMKYSPIVPKNIRASSPAKRAPEPASAAAETGKMREETKSTHARSTFSPMSTSDLNTSLFDASASPFDMIKKTKEVIRMAGTKCENIIYETLENEMRDDIFAAFRGANVSDDERDDVLTFRESFSEDEGSSSEGESFSEDEERDPIEGFRAIPSDEEEVADDQLVFNEAVPLQIDEIERSVERMGVGPEREEARQTIRATTNEAICKSEDIVRSMEENIASAKANALGANNKSLSEMTDIEKNRHVSGAIEKETDEEQVDKSLRDSGEETDSTETMSLPKDNRDAVRQLEADANSFEDAVACIADEFNDDGGLAREKEILQDSGSGSEYTEETMSDESQYSVTKMNKTRDTGVEYDYENDARSERVTHDDKCTGETVSEDAFWSSETKPNTSETVRADAPVTTEENTSTKESAVSVLNESLHVPSDSSVIETNEIDLKHGNGTKEEGGSMSERTKETDKSLPTETKAGKAIEVGPKHLAGVREEGATEEDAGSEYTEESLSSEIEINEDFKTNEKLQVFTKDSDGSKSELEDIAQDNTPSCKERASSDEVKAADSKRPDRYSPVEHENHGVMPPQGTGQHWWTDNDLEGGQQTASDNQEHANESFPKKELESALGIKLSSSSLSAHSNSSSLSIEARNIHLLPPKPMTPRDPEEILRDNTKTFTPFGVHWKEPKPELKSLLLAAKGESLVRRSNACGALKVLTSKKANQVRLAYTRGVLDALVFAASDMHNGRDAESSTEARTRSIAAILHLSEPRETRVLLFQHPKLPECLVKVIKEDKCEARMNACRILAVLSKVTQIKGGLVQVKSLVPTMSRVLQGRCDQKEGSGAKKSLNVAGSSKDSCEVALKDMKGFSESFQSSKSGSDGASTKSVIDYSWQLNDRRYREYLKLAQLNCCAAFAHLVKECSVSAELCKSNVFVKSIVAVCNDFEHPLHTRCIEILCHLTRFPGNIHALTSRERIIKLLVTYSNTKTMENRLWAIRSIQNLASDAASRLALATEPVLTSLTASSFISGIPDEQNAALGALLNLSYEPGAIVPLTNTKNLVATLVHVANNTEPSSDSCRLACDTLAVIGTWMQTLAGVARAADGEPHQRSQVTTGWRKWE